MAPRENHCGWHNRPYRAHRNPQPPKKTELGNLQPGLVYTTTNRRPPFFIPPAVLGSRLVTHLSPGTTFFFVSIFFFPAAAAAVILASAALAVAHHICNEYGMVDPRIRVLRCAAVGDSSPPPPLSAPSRRHRSSRCLRGRD